MPAIGGIPVKALKAVLGDRQGKLGLGISSIWERTLVRSTSRPTRSTETVHFHLIRQSLKW